MSTSGNSELVAQALREISFSREDQDGLAEFVTDYFCNADPHSDSGKQDF